MSAEVYGGKIIAESLRNEGVEVMFGVPGAMDLVCEEAQVLGIRNYIVRHEQAAGYAADGYARALRKPGIAFSSMAPGLANITPAIYHAKGANSPVILLGGGGAPSTDNMNYIQAGHPATLLADLCKWTHRIIDERQIGFWIRKAMRESIQPAPGPITLEVPASIVSMRGPIPQVKYQSNEGKAFVAPLTAGDPVSVEIAVKQLLLAKRPVIIAGDGVYWSDGTDELRKFVNLMQIPVCTRRTARGAVSEIEPLTFTTAYRQGFLEHADIVCLIGQSVTGMDDWFEPPAWTHSCRWIQIHDIHSDLWYSLPTEVAIIGSSKLVLQQMLACAHQFLKEVVLDRSDWLRTLSLAKQRRKETIHKRVEADRKTPFIHPNVLCHEIAEFLDGSSTLILDSFSASTHMTDKIKAKYPGQILDAGLFQTLGHSIGMAIGAQIARPDRQVLSLIGDGGFGIGGMDIETMVRYRLPAVIVLFNNSSWGGRSWGHDLYYPNRRGTGDLSQVHYDEMCAAIGCHTERVTEIEQIRPALERAFASGKPALVNVVGDATELNEVRKRLNLADTWTRNNFNELPHEAQREMRGWPRSVFDRTAKMLTNRIGTDVMAVDLIEMVHPTFVRNQT